MAGKSGETTGPRGVRSTSSTTSGLSLTRITSRTTSQAVKEPSACADALAIRPERLDEEIGVVGEPGRHAPAAETVMRNPKARRADEHRPGRFPFRRANVHEMPRRRRGRSQVRVAGENGLA